jgi:hypothetical protein
MRDQQAQKYVPDDAAPVLDNDSMIHRVDRHFRAPHRIFSGRSLMGRRRLLPGASA